MAEGARMFPGPFGVPRFGGIRMTTSARGGGGRLGEISIR